MVTAALPLPSRRTARSVAVARLLPDLQSGDHLSVPEFLRRCEGMPGLRKAQLIEGIVHMPSPVRADTHAAPDNVLQLWLGSHALENPELECYTNATLVLDADNAVQPDAILCTAPRPGGRVWLNESGYLRGAPELACEVAASSASVDLHEKFRAYRRNGVQEYLVWLTLEKRVRWFQLLDGEYVELKERAGRIESVVFPGLVLGVKALIKLDRRKVVAALTKKAK